MKHSNYLYLLIASLTIIEASADGIDPCWEIPKTEAPSNNLCFYDASDKGLGWKIGGVSKNKADEPVCMSKHDPSGANPYSKTFHWLRTKKSPAELIDLAFETSRSTYRFIARLEYCQRTRPNAKRFPVIPESFKENDPEDARICSQTTRKSDSLLIGLTDSDDFCCIKVASISQPPEPLPLSDQSSSTSNTEKLKKPNWVKSDKKGWPTRTLPSGKTEKNHFKCGKHCKDKAREEAFLLGHQYAGYDGDNWYTGQSVDWNDRKGSKKMFGGKNKNTIFENTHLQE